MGLNDMFDAVVKKGEQRIEVGKAVLAYHRDRWKPGVLRELGRKWAYVQLNGCDYKSRVPVSAVRLPLGALEAQPPPPAPEPAVLDELVVSKEDSWWKIRRGHRLIAILPGAHEKEKNAMFEALQRLEEEDNGEKDNGG